MTADAAPGTGVGTDFYVRRARFYLNGWFDQHIGFLFQIDQGNWGKKRARVAAAIGAAEEPERPHALS